MRIIFLIIFLSFVYSCTPHKNITLKEEKLGINDIGKNYFTYNETSEISKIVKIDSKYFTSGFYSYDEKKGLKFYLINDKTFDYNLFNQKFYEKIKRNEVINVVVMSKTILMNGKEIKVIYNIK